jgi:hypothetical protein
MRVAHQLALQESVRVQERSFPEEQPQGLNQTVRHGPEIEHRSKGSTMKAPEHGFSPATPIAREELNGNSAQPQKRNLRGALAVS